MASHEHDEKALKPEFGGGRVFMLEFRVAMPIDVPRAHVALLFDLAGSCRTNKNGHLVVIAGYLAHVVVENVKTRQTKLEIRPVSSIDKETFINPKTISRVYFLGLIHPIPRTTAPDGARSVGMGLISRELFEIYYSLIESDDEVSEGEVSLVRRSEYEEKRHFKKPRIARDSASEAHPSTSLTDSGSVLWRVCNPKGDDMWLSSEAVQEKPKTLKDSNQSIILGYPPSQRDSIRSEQSTRHSSDSISGDPSTAYNGHSGSGSSHTTPRTEHDCHGPFWDDRVNCLTFCKQVCYHWSDLSWPEEGLCGPILWPLASLNVHLALGYPEHHSILAAPASDAIAEHGPSDYGDQSSEASSSLSPHQHHRRKHHSPDTDTKVEIPIALPRGGILTTENSKSDNIFKRAFRSTKKSWKSLFTSKEEHS